mgnify:CR=1 FL=1
MEKIKTYDNLLEKIKNDVTDVTFKNYFKQTVLHSLTYNSAKIICNSGNIQKEFIEKYYFNALKKYFLEVTENNLDIILLTKDDLESEIETPKLHKNNLIINNFIHKSNLNKNLTFDTFIVGKSNAIAAQCARVVSLSPGDSYNPFYLYGNSGVGKTHLMQAIGNYIEDNTNKKVLYVPTEEFISDFTSMARQLNVNNNTDKLEQFKNKYRNIDVLIIDDIQSLGTTKTTQEEFFNIFNELHNNNKQIIVSSDSSPNDLKKLEERLKTRFLWSGAFNIDPPDYDLRINIIKSKIKEKEIVDIDNDSIEYIATNISSDVRSLEGAIKRILLYHNMYGTSDLNTTIDALRDLIGRGTGTKNDINHIQKIVADYYRISVDDLKAKRRSPNILIPRQIALYLCNKHTKENLSKIGIEFGQTHSTVINAINRVEKMIKTKIDMKKVIKDLENDINKQ